MGLSKRATGRICRTRSVLTSTFVSPVHIQRIKEADVINFANHVIVGWVTCHHGRFGVGGPVLQNGDKSMLTSFKCLYSNV